MRLLCTFKTGSWVKKISILVSLRQTTKPVDKIAIYILEGLPKTNKGNEFIIIVDDYFLKWKDADAVSDHTAFTVADELAIELIAHYGV